MNTSANLVTVFMQVCTGNEDVTAASLKAAVRCIMISKMPKCKKVHLLEENDIKVTQFFKKEMEYLGKKPAVIIKKQHMG